MLQKLIEIQTANNVHRSAVSVQKRVPSLPFRYERIDDILQAKKSSSVAHLESQRLPSRNHEASKSQVMQRSKVREIEKENDKIARKILETKATLPKMAFEKEFQRQ